jgi:hypothetical protein
LLSTFFKFLAEKGVLTSKHFEAGFMDVLEFVEDLVLHCEHEHMWLKVCVCLIGTGSLEVHLPLLCLCEQFFFLYSRPPSVNPFSLCVCMCVRAFFLNASTAKFACSHCLIVTVAPKLQPFLPLAMLL